MKKLSFALVLSLVAATQSGSARADLPKADLEIVGVVSTTPCERFFTTADVGSGSSNTQLFKGVKTIVKVRNNGPAAAEGKFTAVGATPGLAATFSLASGATQEFPVPPLGNVPSNRGTDEFCDVNGQAIVKSATLVVTSSTTEELNAANNQLVISVSYPAQPRSTTPRPKRPGRPAPPPAGSTRK
ncbi:MAG: hypothetical protein HOO96_42245 [Polyangiaceae bacterium]|nr:hypothetical protein [Polyangiaceae bacterium]